MFLDKYFPLYLFVFLLSLLVTALIERRLIHALSGKAAQPIYADGPSWHLKKTGTPTMGGVAFIIAVALSLCASAAFLYFAKEYDEAVSIVISALFAIANALVGLADDLTKLKRKKNAGLSPMQKLVCQTVIAILFLLSRKLLLSDTTELAFSFGKIDLGGFYLPLSIIAILGTVNCANITDGIDGLASGVAFSIGTVLFYISASLFSDVAIVSSCMMGAAIGFLIFNIHPAKIFMGDTGSLFFGALAVSGVFSLKNPLIMLFIGGVYLIEGASVILQVVYFKLTGKRIFKMAPLHHHLEKSGMSETKICMLAIILTFLLSIPAFILYLP